MIIPILSYDYKNMILVLLLTAYNMILKNFQHLIS